MTKDELQKAVDDVITDCIRNDYAFGNYAHRVTEAVWPVLEAAEKERDDVAQQLVQSEIGKREISEAHDAMQIEVGKLKDLEVSRCVKINGYIVDNARLAEEVERLRAKIEQMEKRLRLILEEPENTMSNSKALREMVRQARLALEESK